MLRQATHAHMRRAMANCVAAWWQAVLRQRQLLRSTVWWRGAAKAAAWAELRRRVSRAVICAQSQVHWHRCTLQHGLWALRYALSASAALMGTIERARGRLVALRTARAFGVWAGSAAAVNLWLRAVVARWAKSQSWAFARWAEQAAAPREARAVLVQASGAHRRRVLVGAVVAWRGPIVRRRRLIAYAVRWRGATVANAMHTWRETAAAAAKAAAVTKVCTAGATRATLAAAWVELRQRARCTARAEAGWWALVRGRSLRRWRAATAAHSAAPSKRCDAVRSKTVRKAAATAMWRRVARDVARAMSIWQAWTYTRRTLALACARRAYARGYARHSPLKGAGRPLARCKLGDTTQARSVSKYCFSSR